MSDEQTKKDEMLDKIIELFPTIKTRRSAQTKLDTFIEEYSARLWLFDAEGVLEAIRTQELKMEPSRSPTQPNLEEVERTIASLEIPEYNLMITGIVKKIDLKTTSNGKKVAELVISDGTGNAIMTFWEGEAEEIEEGGIKKDDIIRIHNGYTVLNKFSRYSNTEIRKSSKNEGRVEINPEGVEITKTEAKSISEISGGQSGITFTGKVNKKFDVRQTSKGKDWTSISVSDKDGSSIYIKIWDDSGLVGIISGPRVSEGDIITLTDLKGNVYKEKLGLNTTSLSEIIFPEDEAVEDYPEVSFGKGEYQNKTLVMVHEGDNIEFVGKIVKIFPKKFYYDSCPAPNCKKGVKIRQTEGRTEYYCVKGCSEALIQPPVPVAIVNGLINDGYISLRFTAMGKFAEKIMGLTSEKIQEQFDALYNSSEKTDEWEKVKDAGETFVDAFESKMIDGFIRVKASVNLDVEYRGNIELMLDDIDDVDYKEEAEKVKARIMELIEDPA